MQKMLILSLLLVGAQAFASQDPSSLPKDHPFTPYVKKHGNKIRVPYEAVKAYYEKYGQGYVLENGSFPILDLDFNEMANKDRTKMQFVVDFERMKIYPAEVINPDSVSKFFVLDPVAFAQANEAQDFVTAKRKVYDLKSFDSHLLRYSKEMFHIEDWRSLNHPPVRDVGTDLTVWDKALVPFKIQDVDSPYFSPDFHKNVDSISNSELTFGNKLELLENGKSFDRKLIEVKAAKESVLMAVMSFFCDASSRKLEDLLIEKAQSGVDVKLIVEKVWTKMIMKKCLNRMIRGGVDAVLASDLLSKGENQALFHDKFMVIDGAKVIMGGSNIMASDNISTGYNHLNRDNDVYAEGPVATDAVSNFTKIWRRYSTKKNERNLRDPRVKEIGFYEELAKIQAEKERAQGLRGAGAYEKLKDPSARSTGACRLIVQGPQEDKYKLTKTFIEYIKQSQSRLTMTNGSTLYFELPEDSAKEKARETWNKKLFRTIFAATDRGVQLDLIGNGIDGGYGEASNMFNRAFYKKRFKANPEKYLMKSLANLMDHMAAKTNQPFLEQLAKTKNVRAWTLFQYMHSKKFQIDRVVSVVSSYNLEEWSGDKSHESAILCMDEKLGYELEHSLVKDIANSTPARIVKE